MTDNQIKISYLVKKLRSRYYGDSEKNALIDKILWYSYPVVYGGDLVDFPEIRRAQERRKSQVKRARKYIFDMASCYDGLEFWTLTWRDDVLDSTSEETRHRYVSRFLNENCRDYYANIDYGSKTEREHYHAVVAVDAENPCPVWQYGFYEHKPIYLGYGSKSVKKLGAYLHKIVLHSKKLTSGRAFHKRGLKHVDTLPF